MLFWKRGKYGLIGVGLSKTETISWFHEKYQTNVTIWEKKWELNTFLIEDYVPHNEEYYISQSIIY